MDVSRQYIRNSIAAVVSTLAIFIVLSIAAIFFYRLTWHPLARFPGPKLAAVSGWYETYYDCLLLGKFSEHINRLHQEYGPVVRINPWELHIKDPAFFDHIYTMTPKLDKDAWYYHFIGIPQSAFATPDAELHRLRRRATSRLFSASRALYLQPLIESCVAKLIANMRSGEPGQPINLSHDYWCMAHDVVTGCMMPHSKGLLDNAASAPRFGKMFKALAGIALRNRHFSCLFDVLLVVPRGIVRQIAPTAIIDSLDIENDLKVQSIGTAEIQGLDKCRSPRMSIPQEIFDAPLPLSEKAISRVTQEATMIVGAGTEAIGAALSIITFYLLADPEKTKRLKEELASLQPSENTKLLSYLQLKQSPYLCASIREGLRLSKESNRLPRINRNDITWYRGQAIPAGTVISMSLRDIHLDASIYENPHQFQPERWLKGKKKDGLDRFFVPFGKGSRGCVGRELALVELYVTIGNLFNILDLELHETTEEDIRLTHDFFSLDGAKETKGLRVVVR